MTQLMMWRAGWVRRMMIGAKSRPTQEDVSDFSIYCAEHLTDNQTKDLKIKFSISQGSLLFTVRWAHRFKSGFGLVLDFALRLLN